MNHNEQPAYTVDDEGRSRLHIPGQARTIRMDPPVMGDKPAPSTMGGKNWSSYHWICTLRYERRQFMVDFWVGIGLNREPTIADVLGCLLSDAAGYENACNFDDWASQHGYDPDSRSAYRIYQAVEHQTKRTRRLLGNELYEIALREWERDFNRRS